ncbi:protein MON2-like protein isoform X1 [Gossypium australe]|uniref:Protein MON2-like protein isoform X1 n=1 Tax=Gossypium australe TaxID=47621 RepID=A0A5B6VTK3_9ROSI|nr:protein MON2-like protein isoform X1 [Gossypium australe]
MAFMAVLESDLRALSAEARRRHPAVKDAAEHAILKKKRKKLRTLSSPSEISLNEDIVRIFLMACEVKTVKLSVIGLSCLQKLISHDAVAPSVLNEILPTLKDHAEMSDESVQLKTLQTILIIFQSRLHPESEENMAKALGICLQLLENNRSSDSVRNTAAATFRQAVALVFEHVVLVESLPAEKFGSGSYISRTSSVTGDVNRSMNNSEYVVFVDFMLYQNHFVIFSHIYICPAIVNIWLDNNFASRKSSLMREATTSSGKLGLRLLEDLTALAAGGSACWLHVSSLQRTFALDILEFILSNYVAMFKILVPYEQVLQHQICSLLMTSLRTNYELEGEVGEPYFRRLVLRSVAHIIKLYSSSLITECEVFLSMLIKLTFLDLPLWHRILVLEILRGFCVEARTLRILFQNFDMHPKNTNVVEGMVKALARVVSSVQFLETSEESLAAVAGMFSSKAKGIEWSLDNDASNAAVLVASEAHAISLAIEGLLGVVFTVASLTDEAVDAGEQLESPRCDYVPSAKCTGKTAVLCISMVDSLWLTILDALSLILARSQGEAIVLEILKGYQAFTQACGVLHAIEPLNSFLASLCKFTINFPNEVERRREVWGLVYSGVLLSPVSKRSDINSDQRDNIVLTPKNVQALRTLFNIAHRLHNVLGPSWVLVLETLSALDRAIHSPHAATQEVSTSVPRVTRASSGQYSDFSILSSLNSQLFESSALMHISAVKSLLSALCQLSHQCMLDTSSGFGPSTSQKIGSISFSVERMISILVNNLHRVLPLWDQVVGHFLELADNSNQHLRNMALDALDQSICAVLGSENEDHALSRSDDNSQDLESNETELRQLESAVISPLRVLYSSSQSIDVRAGSLKILLHVLERCGEKLRYCWPDILELLRSVADASEKDLVTLGFQSLRVIMNDGLSSIPPDYLNVCIDVTGAYGAQKTELNISLTAIGLLWTTTDFIVKGLSHESAEEKETEIVEVISVSNKMDGQNGEEQTDNISVDMNSHSPSANMVDRDKLIVSVFSLLQKLGADERPEAATSSKDEWQGKELGIRGGKAVHMLIHHSRNTAQKQWDETLVLVFSGIARLLRSFFPFLRSLNNFWSGWESLLLFVKNSIFNGSKEVSLAAINCLQTTVLGHCSKGNFPTPYLVSVLDVYEVFLQKSPNYNGSTTIKVKQEVLLGLGELYVQAQRMFDDQMYKRLLAIIGLAIKQTVTKSDNCEAEPGHVPHLLRTVLEVLPMLRPAEHLSSMWLILLRELLQYLPGQDSPPQGEEEEAGEVSTSDHIPDVNVKMKCETPKDTASASVQKAELPSLTSSSAQEATVNIPSYLLAEKLIPVLVDLILQAPAVEKYIIFPEVIHSLGRSMTTRRDNPDDSLWRLAVKGFNRMLVGDISETTVDSGPDSKFSKPARLRIWKKVADVYEIFLVGYCGRALPSNSLSPATLKDDESLEMTIVDILGEQILKSPIDAPIEILQRLVSTLDRCASRTCSLPVETVELMPLHCSRFSLKCLQTLFSLSSFSDEEGNWSLTRSEVSKLVIMVLMMRCECILNRFLADEKDVGDRPLPTVRLEEVIFVLQELTRLVIHYDTASVLPLNPHLRSTLAEGSSGKRPHLLVLFPSLSELVVSREGRVRELVKDLLKLIAKELTLEKVSTGC